MTRTISLIIGIGVTALAVAVPTALGEGRLAGSKDGVAYFKANELATLVRQPVQLDRRTDAFDRTAPTSPSSTYRDGPEGAHLPPPAVGSVDTGQSATRPDEPVVSSSSSGSEIDWSQLGLGFGIGIALAFGLVLMLRVTRHQRPLAH
jgi:hypothetical protein